MLLAADWPRPAWYPHDRCSRAPLVIQSTVPAQQTAHKRSGYSGTLPREYTALTTIRRRLHLLDPPPLNVPGAASFDTG